MVFEKHRFRFRQSIRFDSTRKTNHKWFLLLHFLIANERQPTRCRKVNKFCVARLHANEQPAVMSRVLNSQSIFCILLQEIRRMSSSSLLYIVVVIVCIKFWFPCLFICLFWEQPNKKKKHQSFRFRLWIQWEKCLKLICFLSKKYFFFFFDTPNIVSYHIYFVFNSKYNIDWFLAFFPTYTSTVKRNKVFQTTRTYMMNEPVCFCVYFFFLLFLVCLLSLSHNLDFATLV